MENISWEVAKHIDTSVVYYYIHTVGEHLQRIALTPSIHRSSNNITLNIFVRGITVFPRTHFGSHEPSTHLPRTHFGSPEPNTQRHPHTHFGSPERPEVSAGVPLQAGLVPGNSLRDHPVVPAYIGTFWYGCPARAGVPPYDSDVSPPRLGLLTLYVCALSVHAHNHLKITV